MNLIKKILTALILIVSITGHALAALIVSGDGNETCAYGSPLGPGTCNVQTISVHNAWQQNNPNDNGAQWISYADTGVLGSTFAPTSGITPIFTVTETFDALVGDILNLDVWGDDTAEVFINGVSIFSPNFTQGGCAVGSIGCEPGENGEITYEFLASGSHTLSFDAFQVGTDPNNAANPFGLLYSGKLSSLIETSDQGFVSVPEPSALILLGLGILGYSLSIRKNK